MIRIAPTIPAFRFDITNPFLRRVDISKLAGTENTHVQQAKFQCPVLETDPESELTLERNTDRLRESGSAEEINRLLEVRAAGGPVKRVAKVSRVEQIESLEEDTEAHVFCKLEVLRDS